MVPCVDIVSVDGDTVTGEPAVRKRQTPKEKPNVKHSGNMTTLILGAEDSLRMEGIRF